MGILLGAGAVLLAGLALGMKFLLPRTVPDSRALMPLPLEVSGDFRDRGFAGRAFAEAVAVNLGGSREIRILAVPRLPGASGVAESIRQARRAGAGLMIKGRLVRRGRSIQADLFLLETNRGQVLWGSQRKVFDHDVSRLAAAFAREIAGSLELQFPSRYPEWDHLESGPSGPASGDFYLAGEALERGDLEAALAATRQLLKTRGQELAVRVLRARTLSHVWRTERTSSALLELEAGLADLDRVDPDNPYSEKIRADIRDRLGRPFEAVSIYTRLLDRDDLSPPLRSALLVGRSRSGARIGDRVGAGRDLEEAIRQDPVSSLARARHSLYLLAGGHLEGSLERAQEGFDLDPFGYPPNQAMALSLAETGDWERVLSYSGRACEQRPNQESCGFHAAALQMAGRSDEAERRARRAALMLESGRGAAYLAIYRLQAGDRSAALGLIRRSLELGLDDPRLIAHRGLAPLRGDPEYEEMVGKVRERHARRGTPPEPVE